MLNVVPGIAIFGTTDYGILNGIGPAFASVAGVPYDDKDIGIFQMSVLTNGKLKTQVHWTDVTDGLSNTIMFAEDAGRTHRWEKGTKSFR